MLLRPHRMTALNQLRDRKQRTGTRPRLAFDARLAAIIDVLPGGVLLLDAEGCIVESNTTAANLLDTARCGVRFDTALAQSLVDPAQLIGDLELRSGRFITLARRSLADSEVVLLNDVTEAHLLQTYLARQQRLLTLGELAAGLAHQIRTPLATALLYVSQMALPERDAADSVRCAEKAGQALRELDQLIGTMLAFARGAARSETVCVSALLEQVAQWLRPALGAETVLIIRTEAPDLKVHVNAPALVSAILNLATNAMQCAQPALTIELLARRCGTGRAEIIVSDSGPGIPAHLRDRVFEPFFTTRATGTGLGLAIVKSIVEAHGGRVRLDQSCGAMTRFIIDIPAQEMP